jgi:hypothetical protein
MLSTCAVPALPSSIALSTDYASSVDSWTLQTPARFLIGQDGMFVYDEASPDYTHRPDPRELLAAHDRAREHAR